MIFPATEVDDLSKHNKPGTGAGDPDRVVWREQRALARKEAAGERDAFDQLQRLHARGHGHCGEAKRLAQQLLDGEDPSENAVSLAKETLDK